MVQGFSGAPARGHVLPCSPPRAANLSMQGHARGVALTADSPPRCATTTFPCLRYSPDKSRFKLYNQGYVDLINSKSEVN